MLKNESETILEAEIDKLRNERISMAANTERNKQKFAKELLEGLGKEIDRSLSSQEIIVEDGPEESNLLNRIKRLF